MADKKKSTSPAVQPVRGPSPDFSAGASTSAPRPPPRRLRRTLRATGWLLAVSIALLVAAAAALWWWAGSGTSLAAVLARGAQYLPAGQQLESRDVTGSLRSGGHIGWLRWSSPALAVEVSDITVGWAVAPLLQRRLELGEVHVARVVITPQQDAPADDEPLEPLTQLVLPLQIGVPFSVDEITWAGPPAIQVQALKGDYRFDGREHRLNVEHVEAAQGRYSARVTLQAHAPMALSATVDGAVQAAVPGADAPALHLGAHAALQGNLATAAARLQLQAHLRPAARTGEPATQQAMQADVQATLAPWLPQPVESASATLHAVDLAALWPQAPRTLLHGTVDAGPLPGAPAGSAQWGFQTQLRNDRPGPWDQANLPVSSLQARATFDGSRWTVPAAVIGVGNGTATLEGHYTPATNAFEGQVELRRLRPDLLHSAMAPAPMSGGVSARAENGAGVRFEANIRSTNPGATAARVRPGRPAPLAIQALVAQGRWQSSDYGTGGTLEFNRLLLDGLRARAEGQGLRISLGDRPAAQGRLALTVPGAVVQVDGSMAARSGAGELQLQWSDINATRQWAMSLPLAGEAVRAALPGATADGGATVTARWRGGWQTLVDQLEAAGGGASTLPSQNNSFELRATLTSRQLDLELPASEGSSRATALQLRGVQAELSGNVLQAALEIEGEARRNAVQPQNVQSIKLRGRATGGASAPSQWQVQISELGAQVQNAQRPGPWSVQLAEPLGISVEQRAATAAPSSGSLTLLTTAGAARLSGPQPGTVALHWEPVRLVTGTGALQIQTRGDLKGLPLSWVDALRAVSGSDMADKAPPLEQQPLLERMGMASTLVLDGQWNLDTTQATPRASASLRRASGDLRILAGDPSAVTAVQSSGQGTGAGATTVIATEASGTAPALGTPAGVREAELAVELEGDALRARVVWASERAGEVQASANTRLALPASSVGGGVDLTGITWAGDAPLGGSLRARLPDVGVWSALAPPGWRVRGTLDARATLSGTRDMPAWSGTLAADNLAVRSVVDGVDLQGGRLRATLRGNQLDITELRLEGGRGSGARIAGFSGNRTAAPVDGGTLTGQGRISWGSASETATGMSGIAMSLQADANALQVLVRADRQVSVSGQLNAQLQNGQISLRGKLTTDRATIILPDESAPSLGSDVVVRSAAKDREDQARAQAAARANQKAAQVEAARPPDIALTLNLGRDFALQGHGITTRLTGEVDIRSSAVPGAPPRVTGEVRTEEGRYRAWGQMLDVETGLIRFNGPYDNPSLDILALRPNIPVRAGVQVTGSAQAPRVRLYSDPELPDAEKLSWVVLGRDAAAGGAEAAVLQQAALALLGRGGGGNPAGNFASRVGLDEIGFKGPGSGEGAAGAALTFGKRLSKDLYVTYERSLSGTLGTLYIFYDLSRRLTLRGQTGEKSAVDLIYTMKYD